MGGEGFGEFGDVSVEVVRMTTDAPPQSAKRLSIWLIWGGNCGSGDIAGCWWVSDGQRCGIDCGQCTLNV